MKNHWRLFMLLVNNHFTAGVDCISSKEATYLVGWHSQRFGKSGARFPSWSNWANRDRFASAAIFVRSYVAQCPGTEKRRWAPPLVTRFGVITRL